MSRADKSFPLLRADCLEIWDPEPRATPRAFPGLYRVRFTFTFDYGS